MPKAMPTLSPFHNLPAGEVVDQLGSVKAQIADLETREKALRDELIRRSITSAAGDAYDASVTETVRWTLDTKALKAEMGAAWYDARCRQALITTVKVEPRAVVLSVAA